MSALRAANRAAKDILLTLLLFSTILISIYAKTVTPVQANDVTVSPGNSDLRLGNSTGLVTLSYPNSTILTNSVGDLLFTVTLEPNSTQPLSSCDTTSITGPSPLQAGDCQFSIDIYIPPDFTGLSIANVWTSFTNNYDPDLNLIKLAHLSSADQTGPNWWKVSIVANVTCTPWLANPATSPSHPRPVFLAYPVCPPTATMYRTKPQYVRLMQVTSPIIAGRYIFKAFINQHSIGAANFPTLVVKASRDPATISGTLRDLGNRNPSRAGQPIVLPYGTGAQIIATGHDSRGGSVSAQAFINSTANGRYTIFGVAPGTYNLTVYAAGYIPTTITQFPYPYPFSPYTAKPTPISVAAAQSLEGIDVYLSESPNVTGTVLSQTVQHTPTPWGTICFPGSRGSTTCSTNRTITVELLTLDGTTVVATNQPPYAFTVVTNPSATDYHFSIQYERSSWDGRIPQDYANFTSGLPTGEDYLVRAFVTSYVQLAEVRAHVSNATLDTEVPVPLIRTGIFDVTVHFKDFNFTGSDLKDNPVRVTGTLTVSAYNIEGTLKAQNSTTVRAGSENASVEVLGFSTSQQRGIAALFQQNYGILPGTYYIQARFTAAPVVAGNAATTTNAPIPGELVVGDLYYQTSDVLATIGLGQANVSISLPLFRAAGIQLNIFSIDTELPHLYQNFTFPRSTVILKLIPTAETQVYQSNTTQPAGHYSIPTSPPESRIGNNIRELNVTGLRAGSYDLIVQTLGYTQWNEVHFTVQLGMNADASVWMLVNPIISLTVAFRHEGLLTIVNSTDPYAQPINNLPATPTRVEVFDYLGHFVAANVSYVPNNSSSGTPTRLANFTLAGFDVYYGDAMDIWSGFYDTTDQVRQQAGGLLLYPWEFSQPYHDFTVRIWVDGYYQQYPLHVVVPTRGSQINATAAVSVVTGLDRASRISGTVTGPDYYGFGRPLSWATVELSPNNYTLSAVIDVRPGNYTTTSLDGSFQVWVPQGTYGMGVALAGYTSYQAQIAVPEGSDFFMQIWLENYQSSPQPAGGIISTPITYATNRLHPGIPIGDANNKPPFYAA